MFSLWINNPILLSAQKHNNNNYSGHKNILDNLESDLKTIWCPIQKMREFFFFHFSCSLAIKKFIFFLSPFHNSVFFIYKSSYEKLHF